MAAGRLTCGQPRDQRPFPEVTAKCEDLTSSFEGRPGKAARVVVVVYAARPCFVGAAIAHASTPPGPLNRSMTLSWSPGAPCPFQCWVAWTLEDQPAGNAPL